MDCRSDIYSLGATFYHIITGQFPFTGKSATEIARKHLEEPLRPPKLINPQIPDSINRIIVKMMEKSPGDRYQLPEELVEDIRLARRGKSLGDGKSTGSFAVRKGTGKTIIINTGKASKTGSFQPINTNTGRVSTSTSGINASTSSSSIPKNTKSGTLSTSDMRRMKEKKAMRQVVAAVSVCVIAALFAVGYAIYKMKEPSQKKVTPKTTGAQTAPAGTVPATAPDKAQTPAGAATTAKPVPSAEPTRTPYTEKSDKLLDFAVKNPQADVDVLSQCDEFFAKYPAPCYKCEEKSLADILKIYVPLDEKRLASVRKELRSKHLEEMKKREAEDKVKLENNDRKRREEARKEELARVEKEKEDSQKKRIEDYKQDLEKQKENLRFLYAFQSTKRNFAEAAKVYDSALEEEKAAPEFMKPEAKVFVEWALKMQAAANKGAKFWESLSNTDKLSGMQIEYKAGSLGKIGTVKDGIVSIKTSSGADVKVPVVNLPTRQFKLVAKKMGDQEGFFFYYLNCGDYAEAKEMAPEEWKTEVSDIIYAYLKGKLKFLNSEKSDSAKQEIKELSARYSALPEFSRASQDASK